MIIYVSCLPGAEEDLLEQIGEREFRARIKSPPVHHKANFALRKLLARKFNVSTFNVQIKNPNARKKIIEIIT